MVGVSRGGVMLLVVMFIIISWLCSSVGFMVLLSMFI